MKNLLVLYKNISVINNTAEFQQNVNVTFHKIKIEKNTRQAVDNITLRGSIIGNHSRWNSHID